MRRHARRAAPREKPRPAAAPLLLLDEILALLDYRRTPPFCVLVEAAVNICDVTPEATPLERARLVAAPLLDSIPLFPDETLRKSSRD